MSTCRDDDNHSSKSSSPLSPPLSSTAHNETTCIQGDKIKTNSHKKYEHEADIIIVGGGAAGIGLLYGLLLPYTEGSGNDNSNNNSDGINKRQYQKIPKFTIAIVERGDNGMGEGSELGRRRRGGGFSERYRNEGIIRDPKQWFRASHPLFQYSNKNTQPSTSASTSVSVYHSTPQRGLNGRKLLIPTGRGLGGGTNINATLITKPNDDDFSHWPRLWREIPEIPKKHE